MGPWACPDIGPRSLGSPTQWVREQARAHGSYVDSATSPALTWAWTCMNEFEFGLV